MINCLCFLDLPSKQMNDFSTLSGPTTQYVITTCNLLTTITDLKYVEQPHIISATQRFQQVNKSLVGGARGIGKEDQKGKNEAKAVEEQG